MKKFIVMVVSFVMSVSAFAMGTYNFGIKANGCNVVPYIGYDILTLSNDNTETWLEPRIGFCGAMIDNTEKAISLNAGLTIANVYYDNGFFYAVDGDFNYGMFDDARCYGGSVGAKIGMKMYTYKFSIGVDKGFYHCTGDNVRKCCDKYPTMFSMGVELFY